MIKNISQHSMFETKTILHATRRREWANFLPISFRHTIILKIWVHKLNVRLNLIKLIYQTYLAATFNLSEAENQCEIHVRQSTVSSWNMFLSINIFIYSETPTLFFKCAKYFKTNELSTELCIELSKKHFLESSVRSHQLRISKYDKIPHFVNSLRSGRPSIQPAS